MSQNLPATFACSRVHYFQSAFPSGPPPLCKTLCYLAEHKLNYPVLTDVLEVGFTQEQDTVLDSESLALYKQLPFVIVGIMCSNFICSEQDVPRMHPVFFLYW